MDASLLTLAGLAGTALVAGFVDSIAGGGGLITVPALLLAGFDPLTALATNKLQSSFGSGSAAIAFARRRLIDWRACLPWVATTFAGAMLGVFAVRIVPLGLLQALLPCLLVAMALYFALSPKLRDTDAQARIGARAFGFTVAPLVGFYDGVFGPGTGSFFMLGLVLLLGFGVVRATGTTKLLNFTSNIAALLTFLPSGHIVWTVGLAMGLGQMLGAQAGSHLAIRHGARVVRPLLVVVCLAMAGKLLADPGNPVRRAVASWSAPAAVPGSRTE